MSRPFTSAVVENFVPSSSSSLGEPSKYHAICWLGENSQCCCCSLFSTKRLLQSLAPIHHVQCLPLHFVINSRKPSAAKPQPVAVCFSSLPSHLFLSFFFLLFLSLHSSFCLLSPPLLHFCSSKPCSIAKGQWTRCLLGWVSNSLQ